MLRAEEAHRNEELKKLEFSQVNAKLKQSPDEEFYLDCELPNVQQFNITTLDSALITPEGLLEIAAPVQVINETDIQFKINGQIDSRLEGEEMKVKIKFVPNNTMYSTLHQAAKQVDEEVVSKLFPDITKAERQEQNYEKKIDWVSTHTELNPEQETAVRRILANSSKPFLYIILGPPGTGKTATLTEAILQLLQTQSDCRIIVAAPSNAAVDNLALKLLDFVKPNEIVRIYSQTRFDQKIDTRLAKIASCGSDIRTDGKRILCLTLGMSAMLKNVKKGDAFKAPIATHIVVDEAGQATEPELVLALSNLCTDESNNIGRRHISTRPSSHGKRSSSLRT
jgi:hypothetical protein